MLPKNAERINVKKSNQERGHTLILGPNKHFLSVYLQNSFVINYIKKHFEDDGPGLALWTRSFT